MKPRKCSVLHCLSDARRREDEGVTFHRFPLQREVREQWMMLCRIDLMFYKRVLYACSRHFLRADFCHSKGKKYTLLSGVEPSIFSWNKRRAVQDNTKTTPQNSQQTSIVQPSSSNVDLIPSSTVQPSSSNVAPISSPSDIKPNKIDKTENLIVTKEDSSPVKNDVKNDIKTTEKKPEMDTVKKEDKLTSPSAAEKKLDMSIEHFKSDVMSSVSTVDQKPRSVITPTGTIIFLPDMKIEALDCQQNWSPATIVEIDCDEDEVLVHFDEYSSKHDEWLSMSSSAIRAPKTTNEYEVGEKCLAYWSDSRKFAAKVVNIVDKDTCEVEFEDGYRKILRTRRMTKQSMSDITHSSPLFEPVKGSKQDRRDKKRKINVSELFGKRARPAPTVKDESAPEPTEKRSVASSTADDVTTFIPGMKPGMTGKEDWIIKWKGSIPVGEAKTLEFEDGFKKTIRVSDSRLPEKWEKHFSRRSKTGKWEILIVNPGGVKFRSLKEIRAYYVDLNEIPKPLNRFDFTHMRPMQKSTKPTKPKTSAPKRASISASVPLDTTLEKPDVKNLPPEPDAKSSEEDMSTPMTSTTPTTTSNNTTTTTQSPQLKILHVDDSYRCPIDGCGKNFRRENLAQMHIKHYHPEQFKLLDGVSTPNVADLAYARTITDSLETAMDSTAVSAAARLLAKGGEGRGSVSGGSGSAGVTATVGGGGGGAVVKQKDAEIIRLLMNKHPTDCADQTTVGNSGNTAGQDIRLKDLLHSSSGGSGSSGGGGGSTTSGLPGRPPGSGIRTLLPVVRDEKVVEGEVARRGRPPKRKRDSVEGVVGAGGGVGWASGGGAAKEATAFVPEYTDGSQSSQDFRNNMRQQQQQQQQCGILAPSDSDTIIEGGQVIRLVRMRQEEIINCACNYMEEDGLMIQCEVCLCWQHATCFNIYTETQVPDNYICHICRNPNRMRPSRAWCYDQEWLKHGRLPTGKYRAIDSAFQNKRNEQLRRSHDQSGGLLELRNFMRILKLKIKISENKNHPKLYLWSKPWPKNFLPEKSNASTKSKADDSSMLFHLLKNAKNEHLINHSHQNETYNQSVGMPTPEVAIENSDCRLNLLEHIDHCQNLVEERLDDFDRYIDEIDPDKGMFVTENEVENCRIRDTMQMLMRDLENLNDLSQTTTF